MIAVIDNYDSFTFNLVHYLQEFDEVVDVFRNDQHTLEELETYSHIVISPGPGLPNEAPFINEIYTAFSGKKKILGVCLGMQAMIEFYGGSLFNLPEVLHGRQGLCDILEQDVLFKDIASPFLIGHYHSWGVNDSGMPANVQILARDQFNRIMIVKHKDHDNYGVQFHPESVLCPDGKKLLSNWLKET
jgi:anthranilate synthase component 2